MKSLAFLFVLFIHNVCFAFSYEVDAEKLLHPSALTALFIQKQFAEHGLENISGLTPLTRSGFRFDHAFVESGPAWKKSILLKSGLRAPKHLQGVLREEATLGLWTASVVIEETPYVVVALGFQKAELQKLLKPWLRKTVASRWSLLVTEAHAEELVCDNKPNYAMTNILDTKVHLEDSAMLRAIGRCALDAFHGAQKSVGGTLEFFEKLKNDPRALAKEMKDSAVELYRFTENLSSELKQMFSSVEGLTSEEKTQLACTLTGQVLTTAAQGIVTGVALLKGLPALLVQMRRGFGLVQRLVSLEKSGVRFGSRSAVFKEVLSCGF